MKPMKAEAVTDFTAIKWPKLLSPKLDGFRCVIKDGVALTNSLKPIVNKSVQAWAKANAVGLEGLDGELIVGQHDEDVYNRTTSGLRRQDGEPDFYFHVFDRWDWPDMRFDDRYLSAQAQVYSFQVPRTVMVPQHRVASLEEMAVWEDYFLHSCFEGVMLRNPAGTYKYGRSTEKEGTLLKVKRFTDDEAVIIGYEEEMHNDNDSFKDELGRTKRSTVASGLVGKGTLGALACVWRGVEFRIGTGFSAALRAELWSRRDELPGQHCKFKYFVPGTVDAPRHPVFLGLRAPEDMSE